MGSNGLRMALGAGAAVAILGVAVVLEPWVRPQDAALSPDPVAMAAPAPTLADEGTDPQAGGEADAAPDTPPGPDPVPEIPAPVIDVVRIAPDGTGIVAGRAMAGAVVSVMLDDAVVAEVVADASGSFAAFVTLPPSGQPRSLSLIAGSAGAVIGSDATVIVAPNPVPDPPTPVPEVVVPEVVVPEEVVADATVAQEISPDIIAQADIASDVPALEPDTAVAVPLTQLTEAIAPPQAGPETAPQPDVVATAELSEVGSDTTSPAVAETQQTAAADPSVLAEVTDPETVSPETELPETGLADLPIPAPAQELTSTQTDVTLAEASPAVLPNPASETPPESSPELTDTVAALQPPIPDAPGVAPVLRMDEAGVRVLQPAIAPGATPEVLATVALDAIAYDAAGDVQLSGRAAGGGTVRIYVDNRPVIDVPVGADGQWASGLPDVPTGVYTMRVDQLDAGGAVVSRIETPFLREERATIAAAMVDQTDMPDFTVAVKTVQPGATLWAIARERYGDGVMYVQVFEANRDRIRNPDLIYPGQVFVLPEIEKP